MKTRFVWQKSPCLLGFLVLSMLLFCLCHSVFAESQGRRSVLLICSFDRSFLFNTGFVSGLNAALEPYDLNRFEFFQENINKDQIDTREYWESLVGQFRVKYASRNFDAIITLLEPAYDFILKEGNVIFPGVPVIPVFSQKKEYSSVSAGRQIFPVSNDKDIEKTIELIFQLQPTVQKLLIVSGSHPRERIPDAYMKELTSQLKGRAELIFLPECTYDELLATVSVLKASDAILFVSFLRDISGNFYIPHYVAGKLSEMANCPVYGIVDTLMDRGIVGDP